MKLNDKIIGVLAILAAFAIAYGTLDFRAIPGQQFGSAFFPRIIAGAFILLGLAFLFAPNRGAIIATAEWMRSWRALKASALLIAGLLWIVITPSLGFIATTFFLILALILTFGGRFLIGLGVAVGITLLLYGVFGQLLRIPLPFGFIERLLL